MPRSTLTHLRVMSFLCSVRLSLPLESPKDTLQVVGRWALGEACGGGGGGPEQPGRYLRAPTWRGWHEG